MQSPSTHLPPTMIHQRHANDESQAVQSPSTLQPTPIIQQANASETQAARWVYGGYVPPAKRRKMTSSNHFSLETMLQIVEQHVQSCGGITCIIARRRIGMLQEACRTNDYFYVALHQVFSLWTLNPDLAARRLLPQGGTDLEVPFSIIRQLITQTTTISMVHTGFFSTFPGDIICKSDQFGLAMKNVGIFLSKLSLEWPKYSIECAQRGYLPLVDELVNRFGLLSPILQRVIFTAIRRGMGFPDNEYSAQMDQIFNHDLETHCQMAVRVNTAYPPAEGEIEERNRRQANRYRPFFLQARQMKLAHLRSNLARPSQPNLPESVWSPTNIPSATRAEQPPPIRTNVMSSELATASPWSATLPAPPRPPLTRQTPHGSVSEHLSWSPMHSPHGRPSRTSRTSRLDPTLLRPIRRVPPPSQTQNMQHRQGQVNDIVRSASQNASRNASRNASLSQFPGAGTAGSSPVLTDPVRHSSSVYTNITPALASMPAGQGSPLPQQQVSRVPLIPPVGYTAPYQFPQPDCSALHQAHLRSPILRLIDADRGLVTNQTTHGYYQAVQGFAVNPTTLLDYPSITKLSFTVSKSTFRNIAEDKPSDPTAPPLREVRQGSLQYRVRCSRMNSGAQIERSDFVVTNTNWPPHIFMEMNDSVLELRRKNLHGKGPPVDITYHVFGRGSKKENVLRISVPSSPKTGNDILYSIAIEVVEVLRHQQIVDMCLKGQRITVKDVIKDIRAQLSNSKIDEDDDVALVSANLAIDLTDPFTSRIFTTPVRGVRCRHRECFDLETFLISRSNKLHEVDCMPDVWKCPLCGGDATPRSLRVDDFLVSVREKLEKDGHLEVKAIVVAEDGSWTTKPEAPPAVRLRGGTRSVPREDCDSSSPSVSSGQGNPVVEVIDVGDD